MELTIYKTDGTKASGKAKLNDAVFGIEPNDHAIYLDVKQHMAQNRSGTHKSKERSEITGSRKKLKRQKGTGTARVGDIKNPLFKGGGRVFGPRPHDYDLKVNKKVKQLARKSALSYKAIDKKIRIVEDFTFENPSTKHYATMLDQLKVDPGRILLILPKVDANTALSSRNIPFSEVTTAADVSTYEILKAGNILMTTSSVKTLESLLISES